MEICKCVVEDAVKWDTATWECAVVAVDTIAEVTKWMDILKTTKEVATMNETKLRPDTDAESRCW